MLSLTGKDLFLTGARLGFGFWVFYVGLSKWLAGASGFVAYISSEFANTWSPAPLNTVLAWTILVLEPVLGLWLMSGKAARLAWLAMAGLMFVLTFGMTILMKYDIVANNFQYFFLCLGCSALTSSLKINGAGTKS